MKTIKELEAELENVKEITTFEQRDAKRFDVFARIETLKDVIELINDRIEHYDLKLDTKAQVALTQLKKRIEG